VLGWPGAPARIREPGPGRLPTGLRPALVEALGRVPGEHGRLMAAIAADAGRVEAAAAAAEAGASSVWVRIGALARLRERFEAAGPARPEERVVMELGIEALDGLLERLLEAWGERGPVAVVSPVGRRRPEGWAAVRNLLAGKGGERVTARGVPPGIAVVMAPGAVPGRRFAPCQVVDVTPTLTYLLDVPLPTWVEGRVILEAIEPGYLAEHPLRVAE